MSKRMVVTLQSALILLVLLLAVIASLNIAEVLNGEEAREILIKSFGIWCVCTLAALAIAHIAKPKAG